MNGLLSPQFSNQHKHDLFHKQRSPSMRTKRIPSVQEPLCASSHQLKTYKPDSPSKSSSDIKRRKSQYADSNPLNGSGNKKKTKSQTRADNPQDPQAIVNSIQDLKEEYRSLRQAYKSLIQQKLNHKDQMQILKNQNNYLRQRLQQSYDQQKKIEFECKQKCRQLQMANKQMQLHILKVNKLENDLYFLAQKQKSKTQNLHIPKELSTIEMMFEQKLGENNRQALADISYRNNQSHLLSFSLSSIVEQSLRVQPLHRRKQHTKVISDLSHTSGLKNQLTNTENKAKKQSISSFKKQKKDKVQMVIESKQSKAMSVGNPMSQMLNFKSPTSADKKSLKSLGGAASTKRRKQQQKQNIDIRNSKKKSKKLFITNE